MRRRRMPLNRVLRVRAAIAQCRPDRIALSVAFAVFKQTVVLGAHR